GDLNGDGLADVVVGAPLADPGGRVNAGSIYVFFSPNWAAPALRFDGEKTGDLLGTSVAITASVDLPELLPDVIVGAPRTDPNGLTNAGTVYAFKGTTLSFLGRTNGTSANEQFGRAVAGGGRLISTTSRDVAATAPGAKDNTGLARGAVRGLNGADGTVVASNFGPSTTATTRFGEAVQFVGDLSTPADGRDAFVVGDPNRSEVYLYRYAGSPANYFDLRWTVPGPGSSEYGEALAILGDLNSDGAIEFAVGAPIYSNRGRVQIV